MTPNADSGRVIWRNYRPANGTEGEYMRAQTCGCCERDHAWHENPDDGGDSCPILMDGLFGEHSYPNPDGPPEWSYSPDTGEYFCSGFEGPCVCVDGMRVSPIDRSGA
jgi:hypothetical protein